MTNCKCFVCVDQVLFGPSDPRALPEEAQRPGTTGNAQLPLVCTCKFHHLQICLCCVMSGLTMIAIYVCLYFCKVVTVF